MSPALSVKIEKDMIKRYGVYGKVEFVMSVSIANTCVCVDFSGGSITNRGVIPASYTTNNPLVQKALEGSNEFKVGVVSLIDSIPESDDVRVARAREEAERSRAEAEQRAKEEAVNSGSDTRAESQTSEQGYEAKTEAPAHEQQAVDNQSAAYAKEVAPDAVSADESGAKTTVEVTCFEDAVEYLKANFGYTSSKLRTKPAVERAAEEHGIIFVGL